jgi:hypothetical protein
MPISDAKKKELRDLEAKAARILEEMESEDKQEGPKRALKKKKRMGRDNIHQRRQLRELDKESY